MQYTNSPFKLAVSILLCQLAGILGSIFTMPNIGSWYETINQPALSPPNWIFGPVWVTLYALMGISFYLIWMNESKKKQKQKRIAMTIFLIHLFFNATWSIVFFGMQNPGLALINIIFIIAGILLSMKYFYPLSKTATSLLIPYLGWALFATYLNYQIWVLN